MKGFLIRGFNANKNYPVNIYRSMLYIEGENLYLKTSDGTFHLSGNISSGDQINSDNYYTKLEMDSIIDNIQIEGYITVEDLSEYITNDKLIEEIAKLNQVDFNIDEYLKIEDLDNNVTSIVDYSIAQLLDGAPEAFDTFREISDWINANENKTFDLIEQVSLKADKSEIPSIEGLATETFVTEAIGAIEFPETDLTTYETKVDNDAKLLLKADKSELVGLATETFVTEAIDVIDFPETDLTAYEKSIDVDAKLSLKADKSEIPSIDGLATETFVTEAISAIDFPETDLTVYETKVDNDAKLSLKADKSEIPSIEGLATETFVDNAINAIQIPVPNLDNYYDKGDIDTLLLDNSVDLDGYATEAFVVNTINDIEIPEPNLSNYYNRGEVDTLISSLDIQDVNLSNFVTNNQMNNAMETKSNLVHQHSANDITETLEKQFITSANKSQIVQNTNDINDISLRIIDIESEQVVSTDERVKMNSNSDASYLTDLLNDEYIINLNGAIVPTNLLGLESTINELNLLTGATSNIQQQIDSLNSVGNFTTSVDEYSELSNITNPSYRDMVIVLNDTNNSGATSIYIYNDGWVYAGEFKGGEMRNFNSNPILLHSEVDGILSKSKYEMPTASDIPISDNSNVFDSNNVEGALLELFTYANNIKNRVVNVIGTPLSNNDTISELINKIELIKTDIAIEVTKKGIITYPYNTLNEIKNKIAAIPNITLEGEVKQYPKTVITSVPHIINIELDAQIAEKEVTSTLIEFVYGSTNVTHYEDNMIDNRNYQENDDILFENGMRIKTGYSGENLLLDTNEEKQVETYRTTINMDNIVSIKFDIKKK